MTPQLAVYMGAAAPALLGDFLRAVIPPSSTPKMTAPGGSDKES